MQNVTLQIPDNKLDFFMELINNLGFVKVDREEVSSILTPRHIELIEEERRKIRENPDSLIDWEVAQHQINWDAC